MDRQEGIRLRKSLLILFILLLSGCACSIDDTVRSPLLSERIRGQVSFYLPPEAEQISAPEEGNAQLYELEGGEIQIYYLHGYRRPEAIRLLTGREEDELGILCTLRESGMEYRFSWDGQEGALRHYTCVLIPEGTDVYALIFSSRPDPSPELLAQRRKVLASFSVSFEGD